jgi:hypothetical protein
VRTGTESGTRALASRLAAHAQLAAIDVETVDRGGLELRQCREPLQREAVMVASLTRILGRSGASILNVFVARSLICDSSLSRKSPGSMTAFTPSRDLRDWTTALASQSQPPALVPKERSCYHFRLRDPRLPLRDPSGSSDRLRLSAPLEGREVAVVSSAIVVPVEAECMDMAPRCLGESQLATHRVTGVVEIHRLGLISSRRSLDGLIHEVAESCGPAHTAHLEFDRLRFRA